MKEIADYYLYYSFSGSQLHEVCIYVIKTLNDIYVADSTLITLYTYVLLK